MWGEKELERSLTRKAAYIFYIASIHESSMLHVISVYSRDAMFGSLDSVHRNSAHQSGSPKGGTGWPTNPLTEFHGGLLPSAGCDRIIGSPVGASPTPS
jgi:hypothetical protein